MKQNIEESLQIPDAAMGKRLDQVLSDMFPDYSRALIQTWIKQGDITVNGSVQKPKFKLLGGEEVKLNAVLEEQDEWQAENIPLDIRYEDDDILVINKPAGLVVHPAAGNYSGTLLNALLFHNQNQALLPRAGIVHRLDKDTSGLMVVARSIKAHTALVQQIQEKQVLRQYQAIAFGEMTGGKLIEAAIGRHPTQRTKMAVTEQGAGKYALTHVRLIQRFPGFTHVIAELETGRTHQIRVHMSHIGYPLVGDPVYGGKNKFPKACSETLKICLSSFQRQALHSFRLALDHPVTGEYMEWEQALPEDFQSLLECIQNERSYKQKD